jgi:hypothetical protein
VFQTICKTWQKDQDYPERAFTLQIYTRILNGTFYDKQKFGFHEEIDSSGKYIPLHDRRPCDTYNLSRTVVEDSVSLLFSEGHFPEIDAKDPKTREVLQSLVKSSNLNGIMVDAAIRGSVGSVAILFRILENRVYFTVLDTPYLTPEYDPKQPDVLASCTEMYKVTGRDLKSSGYDVEDNETLYWFKRVWSATAETWHLPLLVSDYKDGKPFQVDEERTVTHDLGFVPLFWIKNLPGGNGIDGGCTLLRRPDEDHQGRRRAGFRAGNRGGQRNQGVIRRRREVAGDHR